MLVIDGQDALRLRGKKVVVVDDVVSSGKTMEAIAGLMAQLDAAVAAKVSLFKQGDLRDTALKDLIYLKKLPVFAS
jgi:adenine phosphoribosyltransferase